MKKHTPLTTEQQCLVEKHLHLARWTVNRFIDCNDAIIGLGFDDLCQEASFALCKAAATYEDGNVQFKTYAITVIHNHLIDYCRQINASLKRLPTISFDAVGSDGKSPALLDYFASEEEVFEDACISKLFVEDFLNRRKDAYHGSANLGIEALELKVLDGYGVTDIAQLYHAKPNLVGAWISKATKKIREDITPAELSSLNVENPVKSS